jgi:hypothetical protein
MEYIKHINDLRNELHRKIVYQSILAHHPGSEYALDLNEPVDAYYTVTSRETGNPVTTQVTVTGIDGSTGELIAATAAGSRKKLYYNDLTLEQLARLLLHLEAKLFTVTEFKNDRNLITVG